MRMAYILLTHKNIDHIYQLASGMPYANFYIHIDLKADLTAIKTQYTPNVFFLEKRVDIKWAGFSMIQATINLIEYALQHDKKNEFFHLISGDDVILNKYNIWDDNQIFMECRESKEHRYRVRFNTPHADTAYQRTFIGKALTQFYKKLDRLLPIRGKFYFGSQWFSIRRNELEILMTSITGNDLNFFRKKLCPDEHFFQYLVVKNNLLANLSKDGNKRFIHFDLSFQRGSSPIFLDYEQLILAKKNQFWLARKVEPKEMQKFYQKSNEE